LTQGLLEIKIRGYSLNFRGCATLKRLIISLLGVVFVLIAQRSLAGDAFELYGLTLCNNPNFQCVPIKPGQTWNSLFPDQRVRDVMMRLNRTNVPLLYRHWLVVPKDMDHINYMNLSPLPRHIDTHEASIYVDLSVFAFGAYDAQGNLVYWGPAAGGEPLCSNDLTKSCESAYGTYRIYRKEGADCTSSEYPVETKGGASMPYCMFYYKGFAIHGSSLVGFAPKSKGCVRLFYDDAKWLSQNFVKIGTKITVNRSEAPADTATNVMGAGQTVASDGQSQAEQNNNYAPQTR
jgi:L,D-transpeptidase ErfK/SrfK